MSAAEAPGVEITLPEAINLGIQAQQQGKFDEAKEIYRRVLAAWPDCPDALHFSGLLAFQEKDTERAVALIEKSLALAPEHPGFWNNFGNIQKELGDKTQAGTAYQKAIALFPEFADAHNNLGVMASQRGDFSGAAEAFQRAARFDPAHADAWLNLGNAFEKIEMLEQAITAFQARTMLKPGDPEAYGRLGHIFWQQGKKEEAIAAIIANTELEPGDPMAFVFLGGIFFEQGRVEESIGAFRKAVEINPKNSGANRLLGLTLGRCGRTEEAREVWEKWAEADPTNPVPRHHLLAGSDDQIPARADDDFVVLEFDRFADSFDQQLKHLQYKAPELVADALQKRLPNADGTLDILDAGCGTGLCGPLVRSLARRLEGVDLSPGMLEKARERGGYDELIVAELTTFISAKTDNYDVIISADTLCYFGRLEEVLAAVAGALHQGGYFIFTLERTPLTAVAKKATLDTSGRYTHTEDYVRTSIEQAGMSVDEVTETAIRMELFQPVEGMLVVARKKG